MRLHLIAIVALASLSACASSPGSSLPARPVTLAETGPVVDLAVRTGDLDLDTQPAELTRRILYQIRTVCAGAAEWNLTAAQQGRDFKARHDCIAAITIANPDPRVQAALASAKEKAR